MKEHGRVFCQHWECWCHPATWAMESLGVSSHPGWSRMVAAGNNTSLEHISNAYLSVATKGHGLKACLYLGRKSNGT